MLIKKSHKRLKKKIIFIIYFVIILVVFFRYYKLQVTDYEKYKNLGEKNSISAIVLNAPRGIIYDTNGEPIVDIEFIYDINIIPQNFEMDKFNYEILHNVANINKDYIDSIVGPLKKTYYKYKAQLIKRHINDNN